MAQRTDADLLIEANVIRDETAVGANTALRVGVMLDNLIDSKVNNDNVSNNTGLGGSTPSPTVVPSQNAVKTYVDTLVVGYLNDRGNYDPTITSLYPTTGGSGAGGVIEKGDLFFISADGTMNTIPVLTGYTVRALASAPGQTDGNWSISNVGIGYIPENSASRSTDPTMGSPTPSNVLYPSQLAVRDFVDTQILAAVPYTAENVANKVPSDITLDPTSTVLYPSNAAVVNFVAANLPSGWALAGNAGTTPGTDFIGTTDVKDLVFKTNGVEKMRIVHSGDYVEVKGGFSALSTNPLGNYVGCTDGIFSTAYLVNDPATHGGYLSLQNATGILAQITATNITSNRNYQLPDASGTLALESYKVYTALLNFDGTTVSATVLQNTLGVTLNWTNPINGYFRGTASSGTPFTTDKTWITVQNYNNAGQPYIPTAQPRNAFPTTTIDILMYLYDGTLTGTPNVSKLPIEIRVYP